jgi:hypothetical protein
MRQKCTADDISVEGHMHSPDAASHAPPIWVLAYQPYNPKCDSGQPDATLCLSDVLKTITLSVSVRPHLQFAAPHLQSSSPAGLPGPFQGLLLGL